MFKIETGNKITIMNGDTGFFNVTVDDYEFVIGDRVTFTVKSKITDSSPTIAKTLTMGGNNFDEEGDVNGYFNEDGTCTFVLNSKDTARLAGSFIYDIQLNLADGRVDTIIGPATFTVIKGVTHLK